MLAMERYHHGKRSIHTIGEFGIGCSPGLQRYTKSQTFNRKIVGTIHLAVGRSFPWRMVKDLRSDGRIYCDLRHYLPNVLSRAEAASSMPICWWSHAARSWRASAFKSWPASYHLISLGSLPAACSAAASSSGTFWS